MPDPYPHQQAAIDKVRRLQGRCGIVHRVGYGKTRTAMLAAATYGRRIVVVGPLQAMGVWREQVRRWMPEARTYSLDLGSTVAARDKLRWLRKRSPRRTVFVLVNWDVYWRDPLRAELLRYRPDAMIYDEAHRLIHRRSKRSRFAHSIASPDNRLHTPAAIIPLSGVLTPNGAQDAFSVFKGFRPEVFGPRWPDFAARYLKMGGYYMHEIVGYQHEAELRRKVRRYTHRASADAALAIPDEQDIVIPVTLGPKSRKAYDTMAKEAVAEIEGLGGERGTALGRITLAQQTRLSQMTSGFVTVEDGRVLRFGTEKRDALAALLEDVLPDARRVVIFARFTPDIDACLDAARSVAGDDRVWQYDGRVRQGRTRERALRAFVASDPAVIVMQSSMGESINDLVAAHVSVFYSKTWSLLDWEQTRGRLRRRGQTEKVIHYHLNATKTIDRKIHRALLAKVNLHKALHDPDKAREFFG